MSRTDKDRPYWVRLNDEGIIAHDHSGSDRWGRKTRTRWGKPILDEDGNPVMETVEEKKQASYIAQYTPRTKDYQIEVTWPARMVESMLYSGGSMLRTVTGRGINPLWQEAQNLVNEGKGDQLMVYRTYTQVKREMTVIEHTKECDAHLPSRPWSSNLPQAENCTRELPDRDKRRWCSCSMCEPGGIYAEKKSRTARKNTLRAMAKAYNGEDGWEDDFEEREMYLSKPLRYTSQWC